MSPRSMLGNTSREKLLTGTLNVIANEGFRAATHRKVAEAAGVSLSATNYHYKSMDGLLLAAMTEFVEDAKSRYMASFDNVDSEDSFCKAVVQLVKETQRDPRDATLLYELYAQAARDSTYGDLVESWHQSTINTLQRHYPTDTAFEVAAMLEGFIFLRSLTHSSFPDALMKKSISDVVRGSELNRW